MARKGVGMRSRERNFAVGSIHQPKKRKPPSRCSMAVGRGNPEVRNGGRQLWGWVAATTFLLVVPLAFFAGLFVAEERLEGVRIEPSPVVIPVAEAAFRDERGVQVVLSWKEGASIHAPPWSGIVTRVDVLAGEVVATGAVVMAVDGIDRLAAATPSPFYRPLRLDDRGADVEALNRFLLRLGHLEELADNGLIFSSATADAVEALSEQIGAPSPTDVFDPGWVVWIPDEAFLVDQVLADVGSPAPVPGTPIAAGPPTLVRARVKSLAGGPLSLDPSVAYLLQVGRIKAAGISSKSLRVLANDLARLARGVQPLAEETNGRLLRAKPLRAIALPTTAVMSAGSGGLCVWVPTSQEFSPVAVEAIGAQGGITRVVPEGSALENVLTNPSEVLEDPSCPSS
jgi:hypothetical protein